MVSGRLSYSPLLVLFPAGAAVAIVREGATSRSPILLDIHAERCFDSASGSAQYDKGQRAAQGAHEEPVSKVPGHGLRQRDVAVFYANSLETYGYAAPKPEKWRIPDDMNVSL